MELKAEKNKLIFIRLSYMVVIVLSLLFLYVGNKVATRNLNIFNDDEQFQTVEAVVTEITHILEENYVIGSDFIISNKDIVFNARITRGELKNEQVEGIQNLSSLFANSEKQIEVGDKVILLYDDFKENWLFTNYVRIYEILVLGAIFIILILFFGRIKGFNAIIALAFTCASIFYIFIPALLSGKNIYFSSIIVCTFSIVSTLFIVIGINKKSISSILGCLGGLFITCLITYFMNNILKLTGLVNQEAQLLLYLPTEQPIDLRAIIFASIIIGAVGAIMDVAMSISSSLWEVKLKASEKDNTFKGIFESGINIGKDIMGTMMNTLVLAYIGSSLAVLLLISINSTSFTELANMEMVIVELLRAIVSSFGLFLTIPLTSLICAYLYSKESLFIDN